MPTDTERREVAARLRALDYNDLQESLICAYLDALGIKGYEDWIGIAHHLAGLIEPTCDREALLALADEMGHPIRQAVWNQTAGVRREHIMAEYARRIRQELGVSDDA